MLISSYLDLIKAKNASTSLIQLPVNKKPICYSGKNVFHLYLLLISFFCSQPLLNFCIKWKIHNPTRNARLQRLLLHLILPYLMHMFINFKHSLRMKTIKHNSVCVSYLQQSNKIGVVSNNGQYRKWYSNSNDTSNLWRMVTTGSGRVKKISQDMCVSVCVCVYFWPVIKYVFCISSMSFNMIQHMLLFHI